MKRACVRNNHVNQAHTVQAETERIVKETKFRMNYYFMLNVIGRLNGCNVT